MTSLIDHVMKSSNCNVVVDVGSGLVSGVNRVMITDKMQGIARHDMSLILRKPVFGVSDQV